MSQVHGGSGGAAGTDTSQAGRVVFSSDLQATVVVNATAADKSLPDVVVPASPIPADASIDRVLVAVSWRKSVESSSLANAVNVAQNIQIRDDSPSTYVDAIAIPDNILAHTADEVGPGFMIVGALDVKATVDGADTYNLKWEVADVDGASLTFHDWQCHLIVEYS